MASAPAAFAAPMMGMTCSYVATPNTDTSMPRVRAASRICCTCSCFVLVASTSVAILRMSGTASISISWRLPSSKGVRMLIPVVLPPGRASEATRPSATMSSLMPMIGIVFVASWKARA